MSKRTPNFTVEEQEILLNLVKKYSEIIENKKTDTATSKEKLQCWDIIATEFNAHQNVSPRTSGILRTKLDNIKKSLKKKMVERRKHEVVSGVGPPLPLEKVNNFKNDLVEILETQVTGFPHESDENPDLETNICNFHKVPTRMFKLNKDTSEIIIPAGLLEIVDHGDEEEVVGEESNEVEGSKRKSLEEVRIVQEKRKRLQRPQLRDKISLWAQEKIKLSSIQNVQKEEEFKMLMKQRAVKHLLEIKMMEKEMQQREEKHTSEMQKNAEKHSLEMQLMKEEHALKLRLMKEEHAFKLNLISMNTEKKIN